MWQIGLATSEAVLPDSDELLAKALAQAAQVTVRNWTAPGWEEFDAVAVRSCWDYHLRSGEFLAWLAGLERARVQVLNSPELIRWNLNKRYLADLEARGIRIPPTVWVEDGEEVAVEALCREKGWREAVIKPLVSASAYRTERRANGLAAGPVMVQEFCAEISGEGEWSLVFCGGEFSHAIQKRPAEGDFRVQREYGGSSIWASPPPGAVEFGRQVLETLPEPPVLARVDVLRAAAGWTVMELELIEPELFLCLVPGSEKQAAEAILAAVSSRRSL